MAMALIVCWKATKHLNCFEQHYASSLACYYAVRNEMKEALKYSESKLDCADSCTRDS